MKEKPLVLLNILHGTVQQLTENNQSDSVVFTLDNFMELEFKALCICEHEYLKLVNVTFFEKIIDHNLMYDHNTFDCQELINSGILMMINLAVLKLFIDDRNSFSIEKWKRLHQSTSHATPMEESVILQNN